GGGGGGGEGWGGVPQRAETQKYRPEKEDVDAPPPLRDVHELRQERQEEERRLRVEDVHDHALAKEPPEAPRRERPPAWRLVPARQLPDADVDEVQRAQVLHDVEGERGGDQKG